MERLGGVANVYVNGRNLPIKGDLTVIPDTTENKVVVGMDGVHGYNTTPQAPAIHGNFSNKENLNIPDILAGTDVTVTAELANGSVWVLWGAIKTQRVEINAVEGQTTIRWEGQNIKKTA